MLTHLPHKIFITHVENCLNNIVECNSNLLYGGQVTVDVIIKWSLCWKLRNSRGGSYFGHCGCFFILWNVCRSPCEIPSGASWSWPAHFWKGLKLINLNKARGTE